MKLLKIAAADCPVCESFAEIDSVVAKENGMDLEVVDYEVLAFQTPTEDYVRGYVVNYHVAEDGTIPVPIYLIIDGAGDIKGSSAVKEEGDLHNLLTAWDLYNKSK